MELLPTGSTRYVDNSRVFRRNPLGDLAMGLLFALFAGALGYGLVRVHGSLPPLLFGGLVLLALPIEALFAVVAHTQWGAFTAGLRATNWLARVGPNGVHFNLRSYRNAHFKGAPATVLFLSFGEIESVARVVEHRIDKSDEAEPRTAAAPMMELRLAGVDTAPIVEALRAEARRKAPATVGRIVTTQTRFHDVPVFCETPGVLRVTWHRGLFRALGERIVTEAPRRIDLGATFPDAAWPERARALARRGDRLGAIRLLQREGELGLAEAKAWLVANPP